MTRSTVYDRKPFHEAIVEMLKQASEAELETLGNLLIRTKIPKGHDEIIAAWKTRCAEMLWPPVVVEYVAADLLRYKQDIDAQASEKKSQNPLDRFRFVDEKTPDSRPLTLSGGTILRDVPLFYTKLIFSIPFLNSTQFTVLNATSNRRELISSPNLLVEELNVRSAPRWEQIKHKIKTAAIIRRISTSFQRTGVPLLTLYHLRVCWHISSLKRTRAVMPTAIAA